MIYSPNSFGGGIQGLGSYIGEYIGSLDHGLYDLDRGSTTPVENV